METSALSYASLSAMLDRVIVLGPLDLRSQGAQLVAQASAALDSGSLPTSQLVELRSARFLARCRLDRVDPAGSQFAQVERLTRPGQPILTRARAMVVWAWSRVPEVDCGIDECLQLLECLPTDCQLLRAGVHSALALATLRGNDSEPAMRHWHGALKEMQAANEPVGIFRALTNLANTLSVFREFKGALSYYQAALQSDHAQASLSAQAMVLQNLAVCYSEVEQYDSALECADECLELIERDGFDELLERALMIRAQALSWLGRPNEARNVIATVVEQAQPKGARSLGISLVSQGMILSKIEDFAAAKQSFLRASELLSDYAIPELTEGRVPVGLGTALLRLGDVKTGLEELRRGTEWFVEHGRKAQAVTGMRQLATSLAEAGDYPGAYEQLQRVDQLETELRQEVSRVRSSSLKLCNEVERGLIRESLLREERDELEARARERTRDLERAQRLAGVGSFTWRAGVGVDFVSEQLSDILVCPTESFSLELLEERIHPDDRERVRSRRRQAAGAGEDFKESYRVLLPDGSVRHVRERQEVERGADGVATAIHGALLDTTRQTETESALKGALSQLRHLNDKMVEENVSLRVPDHDLVQGSEFVVGESLAMRHCLRAAELVAPTDSTVLLLGATGSGKELIAHRIHEASSRRSGAMVPVNCAALPAELIESEFFGFEKGSFTGADRAKQGRFELAHGGTLFLDEVGELPLKLQAKLLRVLETRSFERIGGLEALSIDARIIAATNRDLEQEVANGSFRADLFYRLNVYPIRVPALAERTEDVPALALHFLTKHASSVRKRVSGMTPELLAHLQRRHWPGNVRELENWVIRALIRCNGDTLDMDSVETGGTLRGAEATEHSIRMVDVQRRHLLDVLQSCDWRIQGQGGAAERLAMRPSTLRSQLKRLGIQRPGNSSQN